MSFGDVLSDIRRRRRIPMRLFDERAGVRASYIHDVEQGTILPSLSKLEAISSVVREVAREQGADPDRDVRELFRAREWTVYVERLQVDPGLARVFIALRELDEDGLKTLEEPLRQAVELYGELSQPTQRGLSRSLLDVIAFVRDFEPARRDEIGMKIADTVTELIDRIKTGQVQLDGFAADAPAGRSSPTTRSTS